MLFPKLCNEDVATWWFSVLLCFCFMSTAFADEVKDSHRIDGAVEKAAIRLPHEMNAKAAALNMKTKSSFQGNDDWKALTPSISSFDIFGLRNRLARSKRSSVSEFDYENGSSPDYWGAIMNTDTQLYGPKMMGKINNFKELTSNPRFQSAVVSLIDSLSKSGQLKQTLAFLYMDVMEKVEEFNKEEKIGDGFDPGSRRSMEHEGYYAEDKSGRDPLYASFGGESPVQEDAQMEKGSFSVRSTNFTKKGENGGGVHKSEQGVPDLRRFRMSVPVVRRSGNSVRRQRRNGRKRNSRKNELEVANVTD